MKLLIAGSREIHDYEFVRSAVMRMIADDKLDVTEIVSGGAPGVDTLASQIATELSLPNSVFVADWNKFGKAAGPRRNRKMAEYADMAILFFLLEAENRGTRDMHNQLDRLDKATLLLTYSPNTAGILRPVWSKPRA